MKNNDEILKRKELTRSIADLIIGNPKKFREIFPGNEKLLKVFPEINNILEYTMVQGTETHNIINDVHFSKMLNQIPDDSTKSIFIHSLKVISEKNHEERKNQRI